MDYEQYPWPDDFVEGEVPPNDSIEATGIAFRLVKGGVALLNKSASGRVTL
ncbi:hypothetical protein [Klebsiella pneumoniae]|uniref:hypothetical protein n=1 Tax=Klebsiella pneumoniae TaxID=573 RepID=UPI0035B9C8A8